MGLDAVKIEFLTLITLILCSTKTLASSTAGNGHFCINPFHAEAFLLGVFFCDALEGLSVTFLLLFSGVVSYGIYFVFLGYVGAFNATVVVERV